MKIFLLLFVALNLITEKVFYFGVGTALDSISSLSKLGWGLCQVTPWASTTGNEFLLVSKLSHTAARHAFAQIYRKSNFSSQNSWEINHNLLSRINGLTKDEKKLLHFLDQRWLAKSTGFYPALIDWVFPCFGIQFQVHPKTTNSYARSPSIGLSQTYLSRVDEWKSSLPHPHHFPLILTRPYDIGKYLPSYLKISSKEQIRPVLENAARKLLVEDKVILDVTDVFSNDQKTWLQLCNEFHLDPAKVLCIQKVEQESIGGIRIIPLTADSQLHFQSLLDWISIFGLSANRVELDRWSLSNDITIEEKTTAQLESKEEFLSYLTSYNWKSSHPQKTLLFTGTMQVLKGLLGILSEDKWNQLSQAQASIVHVSLSRIKDQLNYLALEKGDAPFFQSASHIEQIHTDISVLLEIFSPFELMDFPRIYQKLLLKDLNTLTSYGIHSSGMTSLAGILKAVEKTRGSKPSVLYGENSYYECINALKLVSNASSTVDATEADWKEVDLILAQFNPALKRIDLPSTDYKVEQIGDFLHNALKNREGKPLTLAIDGTLDLIQSPRVERLLTEFQEEIKLGRLNVICYRSGIKFDLFGMDNYAGSPFFMIHNQDPKWDSFNSLLTDPLLQTDRLSFNWFCLAYSSAPAELRLYQQQILDNTRAILNKAPKRLLTDKTAAYRIIPFDQEIHPAFLDIKITGPFHQIRGAAIVGGCLTIKSMENRQPILYRPSLGFYHTNLTQIFGPTSTTVRLTIGLDTTEIDSLVECFEMIDQLNGKPRSIPTFNLSDHMINSSALNQTGGLKPI